MKTLQLEIGGMTCRHCVASVEKALRGVAGVQEVTVDLAAGRAVVIGQAEEGVLLEAVQEEGYQAQVSRAA